MADVLRLFGASECGADPAGVPLTYQHPDDVMADDRLTNEQKRAILAGWASDAHAVEHIPALRQLESGALVKVDDIFAALARLDAAGDEPTARRSGKILPFRPKRLRPSQNDDEDDPPPSPTLAFPFRANMPLRSKAVAVV